MFQAPYGGAEGAGDQPPRPPVIRQHVVASKEFFDANSREQVAAKADQIIREHWGDISQFILGQRQMGMVLPASYKRKDYVRLSLEYQRLSNQETIVLTAYPETLNPNPTTLDMEVNFDGYFMWAHCEANPFSTDGAIINGSDFVPGPFDVFFNEYLLEEKFAPARPFGGYLLLFGKTALLCESLQDRDHKNTILENAPSRERPRLVTPPPGWGKYNAGVTAAGVVQPEIDRILGYWMFDFQNPCNPCLSLVDSISPNNTVAWNDRAGPNGRGNPNITKGLWFEDPLKSILDPRGANNTFYFGLSPGGKSGEVPLIGACFSEFYDRSSGRNVQQSWSKDYDGRRFITVNDRPLRWGSGYQGSGFFGGSGVTVDLTPNKADNKALGAHDGVDGTFGNGGTGGLEQFLSPEDLAKYNLWKQQIVDMSKAYSDAIQGYIDAWTAKWAQPENHKLLNQARNVEAWLQTVQNANGERIPGAGGTTGDPTGQDRVGAPGADFVYVYGPVQVYWWDWNNTYMGVNPLPKIAEYWFAYYSIVQGRVIFDHGTGDPPDPAAYGGSFPSVGMPASVDQMYSWAVDWVKTDALKQQQAEYAQIFTDHPPPVYPDRPKLGKDYRQFSYRAITGADGVFSYPSNFSGGQ